jgi:hypothetical protein
VSVSTVPVADCTRRAGSLDERGRVPERGVSSFKILPSRSHECVGLKSVEIDDRTEIHLFCFDLDGTWSRKTRSSARASARASKSSRQRADPFAP